MPSATQANERQPLSWHFNYSKLKVNTRLIWFLFKSPKPQQWYIMSSSDLGFSGLYRGCLSTILRDVSFSIIYFPLFAHLKSLKKANNDANDDVTCEAPFYWSFISGCLAGGFAAIAVNPLDVIKTRLQVMTRTHTNLTYPHSLNRKKIIHYIQS